ncbi:MAG: AAA family ATPase, partial [Cyanobacteria bacterium P01_H01_bin.121]
MLLSLHIENFALIDRLDLQLGAGLNVLTGETGAGKSIILDAIDAVLGGKIGGRAVRTGQAKAVLEATFELTPELIEWLHAHDIKQLDDLSLVCQRELTTSGNGSRNKLRVNGVVVNKKQLEQLRDRLVEITAQGQTLQLCQASRQREWLDSFGGEALKQQLETVGAIYAEAQKIRNALEKRRQSESQRLQQLDIFQYQLKDLSAANLSEPDELDNLIQEAQRLSHAVELQQQSYQVYQALYENDQAGIACADLLGQAEMTLSDMLRFDPKVQPILDLVADAIAQVQEAGQQINAY